MVRTRSTARSGKGGSSWSNATPFGAALPWSNRDGGLCRWLAEAGAAGVPGQPPLCGPQRDRMAGATERRHGPSGSTNDDKHRHRATSDVVAGFDACPRTPMALPWASMAYENQALVRVAIGMLRASPARTVSSVAQACHVSRHTLNRAFVSYCGATVRDVRRGCLRDAAEDVLSNEGSLSIKEISAGLGFATPRSFARWVRRENGLAPSALRARLCARVESHG